MSLVRNALSRLGSSRFLATHGYERHLSRKLREHPRDRDLAFALAIGAENLEMFHWQGDVHVAILRHHGLVDGMAVFDLGCGCGRTAQALMRDGWTGHYAGSDIIPRFIGQLKRKCPDYVGHIQRGMTLAAADDSLDLVFHWSVFTHVPPEECYLYMVDIFRALKPGGRHVFSFLEHSEPAHRRIFDSRLRAFAKGRAPNLLDTFLHRDWIRSWALEIGFTEPTFTDGLDSQHHPASWQAVAAMRKPG
jgi:ubiquinone/menaquinone biosynthesis C-methylase UbiE